MTDILLGSETYQLTVECAECGMVELMYVPTDQTTPDVQRFLMGRGWRTEKPYWFCPSDAS